MKCLSAIFTALLTVSTILGSSHSSQAQPVINPLQQEISLPGAVFAVTTAPDGKYVFASMVALMDGQKGGIAILRQHRTLASPVRRLDTGGSVFGLAMTRDGKYMVAAAQPIGNATSPGGVQFIDVRKAIVGQPGALVATVSTSVSAIEVGLSNDGNFVFVANEDEDTLSVIDFKAAIASGGSASSVVGTIPVEHLPVGLAFSGDGRLLYVTNEEANPSDPGYDANLLDY
jgi:hypothetical protein